VELNPSGETIDIDLLGYNPVAGDVFDLVDWSGTFTPSDVDLGIRPRDRTGQDPSELYDLFDFTDAPLDDGLFWNTEEFGNDGTIRVDRTSVIIYQYISQVTVQEWEQGEKGTKTRQSVRAYVIYNADTGEYNSVEYYGRGSNKRYSVDSENRLFSQSLLATDSRRRQNWVISFEGPGKHWTVGDDRAHLDTLSGRTKRMRFDVLLGDGVGDENIFVDEIAPNLRGGMHYEEVDLASGSESRYTSSGKTTMRFSRKLSAYANKPADGGGLEDGLEVVIAHLESKNYEEDR
jgi:hypothetical protein